MKGRPWVWWAVPAILALMSDLASTVWAIGHLVPHRSIATLGGLLTFRLVENTGIAFGLGAGHVLIVSLLEGTGVVALAVVAVRARTRLVAIGLGTALGGGLGNLTERFIQPRGFPPGAVTDWIHLSFYPPTFNLADLSLRVGLVLAAVAVLTQTRRSPKDHEPNTSSVTRSQRRVP